MLHAEKKYENVQEELVESRLIIKKLKAKFEEAQHEIRELQQEQNGENNDLMIQIRQQDMDIKFYRRIVDMVMNKEHLAKLKMKSQYDDATNDWNIPIFLLKNKEIALPSLQIKKQAQDLMESEKEQRQLVFEGEDVESDV